MNKITYDETLKTLYTSQKKTPFFVTVPTMNYLCLDGVGHPAQEDFQIACEALFTLSYIIKFEIARKKLDLDFKINPMEVTWYLDKAEKSIRFTWTMMIMQPDFVTQEILRQAIEIAKQKGKEIASQRVRLQTVAFGESVQCFHGGDYNKMNDTLALMKEFADQNGFDSDQYTHDIYLNDMRKTKLENYKTIMRIKVQRR